jgi:hypothetical protein
MKADNARPKLEDEVEPFRVEGREKLFGLGTSPRPNSSKYGASFSRTRAVASGLVRGRAWAKKLRLNGRLVAWRKVVTCSRTNASGCPTLPIEPKPPALQTAATSAGGVKPLIGAWITGWVMPSNSRKSVRRHMSSPFAAGRASSESLSYAEIASKSDGMPPVEPRLREAACRLKFHDLPLQSLRDGLGSRCGIELPEQRFDMEFDGMRRDAELSGRSLVAQAIAERGKHLDLARRQ